MNFIVYDPTTGKIVRTGDCPPEMVSIQALEGEAVMEGEASDRLHKIVGGEVVDKNPLEISPLPAPDPREELIRAKEQEILRRQAVAELTKEGLL
ncbi:MAG: hypothetical protein Kow0025_21050 [Thermodesulfovibrionales bacterium]